MNDGFFIDASIKLHSYFRTLYPDLSSENNLFFLNANPPNLQPKL